MERKLIYKIMAGVSNKIKITVPNEIKNHSMVRKKRCVLVLLLFWYSPYLI